MNIPLQYRMILNSFTLPYIIRRMRKYFLLFFVLPMLYSCMKKEDYRIDLSYSGENLRFINCPLGGIGTGNILINGYGSIREIEVFNRPAMDEIPPDMTFFALYAKAENGDAVTRIMEREALNEYPNPFGKPRQQLGGIPRFREAVFHNAYPLIGIDLIDETVPLAVSMEAWSPFIPLDPENSGIPCAVIEWTLTNDGKTTSDYSIAFAMGNPLKQASGEIRDKNHAYIIKPLLDKNWKGFSFSDGESSKPKPGFGSFEVSFPASSELSMPLYRGGCWDNAHLFWKDFTDDGRLEARADTLFKGEPDDVAAMNISGTLEPGESVTIPFLFSWHIPYRTLEPSQSLGNKKIEGALVKNYYSERFQTIDDVTAFVRANLPALREKTLLFSHTMITSSVPSSVLDATISNMASLKTNLLMRDQQGNVHAFEGLGNEYACCPGNCTHVWNYAQTLAALFPSLERNIRETGFLNSTHENGYQGFRTVFPLSENWFHNVAADGQMGNIMRVYREWKISGSNEWLGSIWPEVKSALEFAWKGISKSEKGFEWTENSPVPWDPYKEGVLRGDQYNTYDISFFGPNMMTGSLYLGALKACAEMALAMNEPQKSVEYEALYENGKQRYTELLWNGEYFNQQFECIDGVTIPDRLRTPADENGNSLPKYQFEEGCLSDQLLGQYLAFVSGMGYLMDTSMIQQTLASVFANNYREEMRDFDNLQRIYAANGEAGLVLCTWPSGNKPLFPFLHSDEVWTGVEYQVAASLIFSDLLEEGLTITGAVRSRYDGSNRNPFAEIESGRYFARALASWSVYQATAGYHYDAVNGKMSFSPAVDALPHRYFWSGRQGWGSIEISRANISLKCLSGILELNEMTFEGSKFFTFREFVPSVEAEISYNDKVLIVTFKNKLQLQEGEEFRMDIP